MSMRTCRDCPTALPRVSKRRLYCDSCRLVRKRAAYVRANRRYRETHGPVPPQRWRAIKRKYGLAREQYEALLASQGGLCAMGCGQPANRVDHCHETGVVRGILCHRCNIRLSGVEDAAFLATAQAYLERG